MASIIKVETLQDTDGNNAVGMQYVANGTGKHWCNWNQGGTISIYDSFNNSSIVDNTAGYTTIGFSNNFANVNYVYTGGANQSGYSSPIFGMNSRSNKTTSQTQVRTLATANNNAAVDPDDVGMDTVGDLA